MKQQFYRIIALAPLLALGAGSQARESPYSVTVLKALDPARIAAQSCGSPPASRSG
jgi:hypothetical protein